MLKFVKQHMETITGIEIYPVISLLIFFIFFSILTIWAYSTKKTFFSSVENMPLDDEELTEKHDPKLN
jgi:cytochrome c oxidase cbb3-type subunit IV